jgi:hypothetical protein
MISMMSFALSMIPPAGGYSFIDLPAKEQTVRNPMPQDIFWSIPTDSLQGQG